MKSVILRFHENTEGHQRENISFRTELANSGCHLFFFFFFFGLLTLISISSEKPLFKQRLVFTFLKDLCKQTIPPSANQRIYNRDTQGPQNLKYFLSGSLQEKVTTPWCRNSHHPLPSLFKLGSFKSGLNVTRHTVNNCKIYLPLQTLEPV